jgi:very-short-patch-repair endonuclease
MTDPEVLLWSRLKGSQVAGSKFRRQHGIGNYIVDFYCPELKIAIELDGAHHHDVDTKAYDLVRDGFLRGLGIEVMRITNNDVMEDIEKTVRKIGERVQRRRAGFDGKTRTTP